MGSVGKTTFSLFYYQYPLLEKTTDCFGVNLASMEDIAAMKLEAVRGRGTRKDYVDIYFLVKKFRWEEMFGFYEKKYGNLDEKLYELIRIIGHPDDAEANTVMPEMLENVSWHEIKKFFVNESFKLGKFYIF